MRLAFLTSLCFVASPVFAEMQVSTAIYQCERGVEIAESVVSTEEDAVAVIHVEGRQITLVRTPAASGVRYAWPSDGSGYV